MWQEAEKILKKDKYLKSLIDMYGPCKIKPSGKGEYFGNLVSAIVSQQLSGRVADVIFNRLRVGLGREGLSPTAIIKASPEKLRTYGLSFAKIKYLKDLSERVKRGELKIQLLNKLSDEEIINELVKVKGIGRWTAEMFLMFSLARPDVFPINDLGIRKAMKLAFKEEVSEDQMLELSLRWTPYRTVASWYLWQSLT